MWAFLGIMFILAAFRPTADALQCYSCVGKNKKTCEGEVIECPEGTQSCSTHSEDFTINDKRVYAFRRSCTTLPQETCQHSWIVTADDKLEMRTHHSCCYTGDNCNTDSFYVSDNTTKNGLICPFCYAEQKEECDSGSATIECIGNQEECLSFAGEMKRPDDSIVLISVKGCVSRTGCQFGFQTLVATVPTSSFSLKCTEADNKVL